MADKTFSQVTPHIFRLDLPLGRDAVAVFLVRIDDGWSVVDTGLERHARLVMDAILKQTQGDRPRRLFLTHGHGDHAENAICMRAAWGLKVAAGRQEIPYLTEPVFYRKIPAHSPLYYLAGLFTQPAMVGKGVDLPLDDQMMIDGMQVCHIPGHAPGMIALLHRADRALLCADAFSNTGGRLHDPAAVFTYDPGLNRRSQAKLAALDFDHLIPSHGPAIMNDARRQVVAYVEKRSGRPIAAVRGP